MTTARQKLVPTVEVFLRLIFLPPSYVFHFQEPAAQSVDLLLHIFAPNGVVHQLGQFAHGAFVHTEARHFGDADTQAGGIARVGIAGNHVVVDDDVVSFQAFGNFHTPTPLRNVDSDHVAARIAKIARLDGRAEF